jgi:hypothetical protein
MDSNIYLWQADLRVKTRHEYILVGSNAAFPAAHGLPAKIGLPDGVAVCYLTAWNETFFIIKNHCARIYFNDIHNEAAITSPDPLLV